MSRTGCAVRTASLSLGLLLLAPHGWSDAPPAEPAPFPAPLPAPAQPAVGQPAVETPPAPAPAPAGAASLPPPRSRRMGAGGALEPAAPASAPAASTGPWSTAPAPGSVVTTVPDGRRYATSDGGRSWQPVELGATARLASGSRLLGVSPADQPVAGGGSELRLSTQFAIEGDAGRSFYVHALFFDSLNGASVTSADARFADRGTGVLYLLSNPMAHAGGQRSYQVDLQAPYGAFPRGTAGIEARVSLFRRAQGGGMDEVLDWTTVPLGAAASAAVRPPAAPLPAAALPLAPAAAAAPARASILEVRKNHNLPMQDGALGLRLDLPHRIAAAGTYRLAAAFHDAATGQPIASLRPTFADAGGQLYATTQAFAAAPGDYGTSLWVPYAAFPSPRGSAVTEVEARITLYQAGAGGETVAATTSTRFRIHGS